MPTTRGIDVLPEFERFRWEFTVKKLMTTLRARLASIADTQRGASLLEYALLLAFIALASIFAITQIGEQTLSNAASVLPALG